MMCNTIDGYLGFLHRFQQGRLGFGRGTVNFVGKHNLCQDGARPELKVARFLVVDGDACHIAWQEVWGKLDTLERASDRAGNSFCEHSFTHARHIFNQYMSMTNDGYQAKSNGLCFTNDNFFNIIDYPLDRGG